MQWRKRRTFCAAEPRHTHCLRSSILRKENINDFDNVCVRGESGGIRKERKARRNSEDVRGNGAMFGIFVGVP